VAAVEAVEVAQGEHRQSPCGRARILGEVNYVHLFSDLSAEANAAAVSIVTARPS